MYVVKQIIDQCYIVYLYLYVYFNRISALKKEIDKVRSE